MSDPIPFVIRFTEDEVDFILDLDVDQVPPASLRRWAKTVQDYVEDGLE